MFKPTTSMHSRLVLVSLTAILAAAPSFVHAQDKSWTSVGSAGTADEESLRWLTLYSATARVSEFAPADTIAVIRYNVVAVDGLFEKSEVSLTARFFDVEDTDRVLIRLRRIALATGLLNTLVTLDSDAFPLSDSFQVKSKCEKLVEFDFAHYAYWVEVSLTKSKGPRRSDPSGGIQPLLAPAISMIQIKGACAVGPS